MNDQAEFEDRETVGAVLSAVPAVDTAYRAGLRRRLGTLPGPKRRFVPAWRWPALGGMAAVAALILVLVNPFGPRSATPVSAKTLLERAAQAAAHPGPYVATAVISTSGGLLGHSDLPPALQHVATDSMLLATIAVRDDTHWWLRVRTVRPALEAGTMTAVANGHVGVTYWSISRVAVSIPVIAGAGLPIFGQEFFPAGTISSVVADLNYPESGTHARLVGERTVLGRQTYLVRVWPASRSSYGPCNGAKDCLRKSHGYGYNLLWIDKEHLTTLRYEQHGPPSQVQRTVYRVTSITYGQGPSAAQLGFHPPVPVKAARNGVLGYGSGGSIPLGGTSGHWYPQPPFLGADPPRDAQGHAFLQGYDGQAGQPGMNSNAEVSILFATSVPNPAPTAPPGAVKGPYVYIQERIRKNGPPPFFRTGIPHRQGACPVWAGSFRNGIRWLGLQRGQIAVMLYGNTFSEGRLVRYARTQFCR